MKSLLKLSVLILFASSIYGCKTDGVGGISVVTKMCYSCTFPLRIGGITVISGPMDDASHVITRPLCTCPFPPPIFKRVGIPIGFFEPSRLIEVVSDPYCFPLLGINFGNNGTLGGTKNNGTSSKHTFFQAHYMIFPVYAIIGMYTDIACVESGSPDVGYITEIDPLWNDDELATYINPEALLFGNPITNLACTADSVSSGVGYPIDPLFWCMGSWGNSYPLTGHKPTSDSYVQDTAAIASRLIYKLHRELILWKSWGEGGLCGYVPSPIWEKTAYRLEIISPIPNSVAAVPGETGLKWDYGKNIPMQYDNFGYLLFKKRDCCAF